MPYPTPQRGGSQQHNESYSGQRPESGAEPLLGEAWYGATFRQAVTRFGQKALHFRGYASRSEFWWVQLGLITVNALLTFFLKEVVWNGDTPYSSTPAGDVSGVVWFIQIALLVVVWMVQITLLVAQLALIWRRYHDTGRSGALFFLAFIPAIGMPVSAVLLAMPQNPDGRRDAWLDTDPELAIKLKR